MQTLLSKSAAYRRIRFSAGKSPPIGGPRWKPPGGPLCIPKFPGPIGPGPRKPPGPGPPGEPNEGGCKK